MVKAVLLSSCLVLSIAYAGKYLLDAGVFRQIETKGLNQCRLVLPANGDDLAFEDLVIDYEKGVAYTAGDNRSYLPGFTVTDDMPRKQGAVYQFDIRAEKFQRLELSDYPYEHFHPLGMGLLKGKADRLFLTNFRPVDGELVGTVEIFEIDFDTNQVRWKESVLHPLFTTPDDVYAIDEKTFYVTNVYHYRKDQSNLMHTFETMTQRSWTNVLLCTKREQWDCSIMDDSIGMANGVVASADRQTLYVAASVEKRIRVYKRHAENSSLTFQNSLYVPFLIDNILLDGDHQLTVAGHPKALEFLLHVAHPREHRAPVEVGLFRHPESNSTYENLLLTNGELLSAATVGGIYKQKLLVGALCDPGLLVCQNLI